MYRIQRRGSGPCCKKSTASAEPSLEDRKGDDTESKAKVLDNGSKNSSELEKVYHVTLSELADTLTENLRHKLQALPEPEQFGVVAEFNQLFLHCIQRSDVQLDHEDILKLRTDKIASMLPDIIHSAAQPDAFIFLPHKDRARDFLCDLALLEKSDQEAIRVAWSALSESKQQDVALEVDKQFQSCLLYTSPSPRDGLLSRMPSSA